MGIIPEPLGGAHRDIDAMAQRLKNTLKDNLNQLKTLPIERLLELRYARLQAAGA